MIAATCCRCRRELNEKGGVLLRPPDQEGKIDGLLGDWVVKHHVCASCMAAILEWLKQPPATRQRALYPTGSSPTPHWLHSTLTPSVRPTHTTMHVLFEGRPLCGFMAGCVPSGWPDGHKWVSITEVKEVDGKPGFLHDERSTPCDRCLSLASASSLIRNRA